MAFWDWYKKNLEQPVEQKLGDIVHGVQNTVNQNIVKPIQQANIPQQYNNTVHNIAQTPLQGVNQLLPGAHVNVGDVGNFAKDIAQGTVQSGLQLVNEATKYPLPFVPVNPYQRKGQGIVQGMYGGNGETMLDPSKVSGPEGSVLRGLVGDKPVGTLLGKGDNTGQGQAKNLIDTVTTLGGLSPYTKLPDQVSGGISLVGAPLMALSNFSTGGGGEDVSSAAKAITTANNAQTALKVANKFGLANDAKSLAKIVKTTDMNKATDLVGKITLPSKNAAKAADVVKGAEVNPLVTAEEAAKPVVQKGAEASNAAKPDFISQLDQLAADKQALKDKISAKWGQGEVDPGNVQGPASKFDANSWQHNTKANPIQKDMTPVQVGDYQGARIKAQSVENDVQVNARQTINAVDKLSKPDKELFRYAIEDPSLIQTAEDPSKMAEAVSRANRLTQTVHAHGQALGGNVGFLSNYWHHAWDNAAPINNILKAANVDDALKVAEKYHLRTDSGTLNSIIKASSPDEAVNLLKTSLNKGTATAGDILSKKFMGVNSQQRIFKSIKKGESAGWNLKYADPVADIKNYAKSSSYQLKQAALRKGMTEADQAELALSGPAKLRTGESLPFSQKAMHEMRVYDNKTSQNVALKGYRAANRGLKRTLLSASQFHPINIGLQAGPTALLSGHPVRAAEMAYDTAAALVSKGHADKVIEGFMKDGTIEAAAKIGTPILHGSDYSTNGLISLTKKFGEEKIFGQQMPVMHGRLVQGVVADLARKGISLDSPEAREAGLAVDKIMGFINTEARNFDPHVQKGLGDLLLAPQFTRSKWEAVGGALTKWTGDNKMAGQLLRRAVVGKYAADVAIALGVGALVGQNSDNFVDTLKRQLLQPSIPTPWQDDKGNTIELKLPANYISEIAGLVASLDRGSNGRLNIGLDVNKIPENIANYGRSRLAVLPAAGLKLATNTNYAGKPLYDPNADAKTQAIQAATTLAQGNIPIGLQGAVYDKNIMSHLPQASQDILNANKPGANPLLKSIGSSFGLTPTTDETVGKGLSSSRYYDALDTAKQGLNNQESAVMTMYSGSKKNPVTGKYEVQPSVWDPTTKARTLLQNPNVIQHLITMNQTLKSQGERTDPMWDLPPDKLKKVLEYQAMDTGPQKTNWYNQNKTWYQGIADARGKFFDTLPPSDPNKLASPIEYPQPTDAVQNMMNQYYGLTDSKQKAEYIKAHPDLQTQMDKQFQYSNDVLKAKGQAAMKEYPTATPKVQSFIDSYLAADKATRKGMRNSNPGMYQNMVAYFDSTDLYGIGQQASLSQLQGNPDTTSKELKQMSALGQDIYQNADGTYSLVPAGWMQGLTNGYSGGGSTYKPRTYTPQIKKLTMKSATPKKISLTGKGGVSGGPRATISSTGRPTKLTSRRGSKLLKTSNNKRSIM